jgi:hypothetical protein
MKSTSRFAFVFTLLVITFTLLTSAALAKTATGHGPNEPRLLKPPHGTPQTIATTEQNGALCSTKLYAFTEENRALRSSPFTMPETTQYVVSISHGFGNVIRKAPIKRKGNIQG